MSEDVFGIVGTVQAGVFRVERVVAEGGFAVVYRAYHEGFRAPVALKCLKVPEAMNEAQRAAFLEKFREEGEMLFRLSALSPTVVRPLHVDVLVLGETIVPFLALEWLDGEGLDQIVDKRQGKPIELRRLVPFLQPAAQALAQAHAVPGPDGPTAIIHRDIKPENIFVVKGPEGEVVKLFDFGIARAKSATQLDAGRRTAQRPLEAGEGASGGAPDAFTPGYAAPEQWFPKRYGQVGPWTDVFGLAVTMVEVLVGRPPITGDFNAMAAQTCDAERRPTPRAVGVAVPDGVERAFRRALAVDPRERTRSILAFWTELEQALGLPPSIKVADAKSVSLTGTSEPPPPLGKPAIGAALAARALAPAQLAPSRVRRPDGELPAAMQAGGDAPGIPFELGGPSTSGHARPLGGGQPSRAVPMSLAVPMVRQSGTMLEAPKNRGVSELGARLRTPIILVVAAIALAVGDHFYTRTTGELFALGPVRPLWITGPLALIGVGLAAWRLLEAS